MTTLRIAMSGQSWTFEEPAVVRIGRDAGSDVVVDRQSVSRRHLEVRSQGSGWEVVDVGSSAGTWVGDRRVQSFLLGAPVALRLGDDHSGETIGLSLVGVTPPAPQAPPAPVSSARPISAIPNLPAPGLDVTRVPSAGQPGREGYGGGPGLMIRDNNQQLRFPPGRPVRIGREPGLEMTIEDEAVSRQHAVIEPRPDGWWYSDRSTGGTYDVDGDRVTNKRITEPTTLTLGHPTAGYEIEVIPAVDAATAQRGFARKRRKKGLLVGSAVLAGLVLVGGGIGLTAALSGGGDSNHSSGLERAKRASVFIIGADADDTPEYTGSGAIISDTGLILTAAHVGDPEAQGQQTGEPAPDHLLIALTSPEDDKPVEAAYRAKPVVTDGVLDMSVLQITSDADGNPIKPGDLRGKLPEPIPIGNSNDLSTGDEITALGFPALASLGSDGDRLKPSLTVTKGVVATFEPDPKLDTQRAWIDSDVRIGSGNSGGASIDDKGELIGVNDAVITATTAQGHAGEFTGGSALIRPVALAKAILDLAKKGGDPSYVSPYYEGSPSSPSSPSPSTPPSSSASVVANEWATSQTHCAGTSSPSSPSQLYGVHAGDTVYMQFTVTGMADGTDVSITAVDDAGNQLAGGTKPWGLGSGKTCIYLSLTFKGDPPASATATVTVAGRPVATGAGTFQ
ncbi:FHA domain-containing protein [Nocardioides montaniterrae]